MSTHQEGFSSPQPIEGVHYFPNYYNLLGVSRTADETQIRTALRDRSREYSEDRQQGTAEEFGGVAGQVMRSINMARVILLDSTKRQEYDEMLASWTGLISNNGRPVITPDIRFELEMVGRSAEGAELMFQQRVIARLEQQAGVGSDEDVEQAEWLYAKANQRKGAERDEKEIELLRTKLEDALFALDMRLAVEEHRRSLSVMGRNISDPEDRDWKVSIDYSKETENEITALRQRKVDNLAAIASGNVATRLAILGGEVEPSADLEPARDIAAFALPAYFDDQADKVRALATRRQAIMERRLEIMRIELPESELQTQLMERIFVGLEDDGDIHFAPMRLNPDTRKMSPLRELPVTVLDALQDRNYSVVIAAGYNVIITERLVHIEDDALARGAVSALIKHYSGDEPSAES